MEKSASRRKEIGTEKADEQKHIGYDKRTLTVGGMITVQLASSLTRLD